MDLYAYSQIDKYKDKLADILKDIPRLRGIRYMAEEDPEQAECEQIKVFNSYCGRTDVYMIHARIGGNNWDYYDGDETVATKPWFLERVDDEFDSTYCDIYVRFDEGK